MSYQETRYRYRKIGSKYLVTNDYFDWIFLTKKELDLLITTKIPSDSTLFKKLENNNIIFDDNPQNVIDVIQRTRMNYRAVLGGPSLHIIVVTKRCNQQCTYCHASSNITANKDKYDLSEKNAKRYVDLIMTSPNSHITIEFQGGEPLLNFSIIEYIYQYATQVNKKYKKQIKFTIVSNLEEMDEDKAKFLLMNGITVSTSLDGPQFLHDANRPSCSKESSYQKATYWIQWFKKRSIIVGALTTISKKSLSYPYQIIDEYINQGFEDIHLRELTFLGKAAGNWKTIGYDHKEFIDFWKKSIDYIIEINKKGVFFRERMCMIILDKCINKKEPHYLDLMSPCGALLGQIAYNYDGEIYCCDEARSIGEDIFKVADKDDSSLKQILQKDKNLRLIATTVNDSYYCDNCAYKPFCGVCAVCNYRETGNLITDVIRSSRCATLIAMYDYIFTRIQEPEVLKIFESWIGTNNNKENIKK